ncbi:MAG: histidine kinase, partial [Weeksellaceae bacterium]|nr:histidine kinase [Weeksellaceae bacterium]
MNNFKDSILYLISIILVVVIMLLTMLFKKGFAFEIYGVEDIISIVIAYILLGVLTFQVLKGIVVVDKTTLTRNILIMLGINFIIYSIMFFTNPNTQLAYFFNSTAFNYFIGYFLFSLCASFIGSSLFYEYKKEIDKNGFHSYVIWRYFLQSIIVIQFLYYVFTVFVNDLFPIDIFYNQTANYVLVGIITSIFLSIFYYLEKNRNKFEKQIKKETSKAETATANFETLKNQLDPHFLFNSLNVLTGLIEENPEKAVDFTTSLSKIYRYLLEQKDKEVVPLEEEIRFAKTYINLLKLRFENSIHFHMNLIDFQEDEFIVPLSLQILLENTIKHNIVSESKPLKIRIYKEDNFLIMENSFQPKDSIKDSTGVGLNNIKKRYELISDQKLKISNENNLFKVELPILTNKLMILDNEDR